MSAVYGCHNRPPLRGHFTFGTDWNEGRNLRAVRIEHAHVMSKVCEYTKSELGNKDPKCQGCKHKETKQ